MSAYRDIAANQDGGPCGYLRKAVLPGESERRLFLGWPGKELEAAQLLDWWRESRALGCAMLPEAAPELSRKENRFWLSLEIPEGARAIPPLRLSRRQRLSLAAELGRLHRDSASWPAYMRASSESYWYRALQERLGELLLYRGIVRRRGCRTDFEGLFMENFDSSYRRGQEALNSLVLAGDSALDGGSKGWALWGASCQEVLWQGERPLFYGLWPRPSLAMMDLSLVMKSLLWSETRNDGEPLFLALLAAYESQGPRLREADLRFLKAQWLFPEGYWFHARRYFHRPEPPGKSEMEDYFHQFQASILKEQGLILCLEEAEGLLAEEAAEWAEQAAERAAGLTEDTAGLKKTALEEGER